MNRRHLRHRAHSKAATRCFPHVVNIAVQHILDNLKKNPAQRPSSANSGSHTPSSDEETDSLAAQCVAAVSDDPVGKIRDLVAYCRQSDRRRVEFRATIEDGNKAQLWEDEHGNAIQLPLLQLLRDCETRWSSTFLMIKRAMHLYPVSLPSRLRSSSAR